MIPPSTSKLKDPHGWISSKKLRLYLKLNIRVFLWLRKFFKIRLSEIKSVGIFAGCACRGTRILTQLSMHMLLRKKLRNLGSQVLTIHHVSRNFCWLYMYPRRFKKLNDLILNLRAF